MEGHHQQSSTTELLLSNNGTFWHWKTKQRSLEQCKVRFMDLLPKWKSKDAFGTSGRSCLWFEVTSTLVQLATSDCLWAVLHSVKKDNQHLLGSILTWTGIILRVYCEKFTFTWMQKYRMSFSSPYSFEHLSNKRHRILLVTSSLVTTKLNYPTATFGAPLDVTFEVK